MDIAYVAEKIAQHREREYTAYPCWRARQTRLRIRQRPLLARLWAARPRP